MSGHNSCSALQATTAEPNVGEKAGSKKRVKGRQARDNSEREYSGGNSYEKKSVNGKKQMRFIHPQVFKMFQRAQTLMRNGDNVVAQRLLMRCLELNPYDSHSWLALGQLEAKLGNIDRAREVFQQSVARCPNNVYILHAWGHLEQKYGNESVARECWSQAVKLDPLNAYVCHALSTLERRLRNYDRAREILEVVVEKRPTSAICVSLADLERQEGNPERARDILLQGLERCTKGRSEILLSLAWLEEDLFARTDEAKQMVDEALRIDGKNVRVYVAKANMELRMKKTEAARATLRTASRFEGADAQHYTMLSTLEFEAGNTHVARRVLIEGAEKYPGDHFLLQRWGTMEAKLGNSGKARELFEKSVRIQPHAPTFVAWGILEEEEGMRALEKESGKPFGGGLEGLDGSLLDLPEVRDPDVAEMLGELSEMDASDEATRVSIQSSATLESSMDSHAHAADTSSFSSKDTRDYANKQFRKARHLLSLGMIVDPQHGPLYHAYGNMELRHGNTTGARDVFMLGIARNCSDVTSIYHAWGMLELREGGKAEAADIFRRGIELGLRGNREVDNGVGFLLHSLGTLEADNHRVEEAKKVFSTGVNLFPQHSHLLLGLALAEMKCGEYDLAREHFKASVDSDPFHAHSWQSWALAEKQCGNIELARILFRQGLKKVPTHGALWQASAVMEMQQGNIDVARTLFAQALSRCPTHEQSYQAWACLEVRMGNLHKAKALALQGIKRAPNHPALWTVAALVEDRLGEHARARNLLESGINRFSDHGPLYKVLGEQHERLGDFNRAREVFHSGLQRDPHCAPLYHAAALLEARLGNVEGLHEMHSRAQGNLRLSDTNLSGSELDSDIIAKISALVEAAEAGSEGEYYEEDREQDLDGM